jgi:Phosphatidylinositol-4-phosphate 5-Kinase
VLCKIVGVYQIGIHNRETGKRTMEQVAIMQNIFYNKKITRIFDLKGSLRGRFAAQKHSTKDEINMETPTSASERRSGYERRSSIRSGASDDTGYRGSPAIEMVEEESADTGKRKSDAGPSTLLDGDFLEFTMGRPMPLTDRAKAVFQMSILNVSLSFECAKRFQ